MYSFRIFRRRSANNHFEVFDEMRLVEIAKLQSDFCPIRDFAARQLSRRFVQPVSFDDRRRADGEACYERILFRCTILRGYNLATIFFICDVWLVCRGMADLWGDIT